VVAGRRVVLWDVLLRSPAEIRRRFEGRYCLRLQDRKLRNKREINRWQAEQLFYRATRHYIPEHRLLDVFHLSFLSDGRINKILDYEYVKVSVKMDDILCNNGTAIMELILLILFLSLLSVCTC
jgi:hypothetical protein